MRLKKFKILGRLQKGFTLQGNYFLKFSYINFIMSKITHYIEKI